MTPITPAVGLGNGEDGAARPIPPVLPLVAGEARPGRGQRHSTRGDLGGPTHPRNQDRTGLDISPRTGLAFPGGGHSSRESADEVHVDRVRQQKPMSPKDAALVPSESEVFGACLHCGAGLDSARKTYCGAVCRSAAAYKRAKADGRAIEWSRHSRDKERRTRAEARAAITVTCAHCGRTFTPQLRRGRIPAYCGRKCSNAAFGVRRRARRRSEKEETR